MTMTEHKRKPDDIELEEHPALRLTLEQTDYDDTAILHQAGLIDTYNSDFFRNQAVKVVKAGYKNIIIDSSATTFMSSTGIGAYTALLKTIRDHDGTLTIYGMPTKIYEVFQLLGFSSFFRFCATKEDALAMQDVNTDLPAVFPIKITCPVCSHRLKATKTGRFRCPFCRIILAVDESGDVHLG